MAAGARARLARSMTVRLVALGIGALFVGRCGPPATERGAEWIDQQSRDLGAWRAELVTHMQRVELHVPLLREVIRSGKLRDRHVEVRRSHDLLVAAEQSVPRLPAGATDETAAVRQRYLGAVRELRWSAELLLWSIRPEVSEPLRQTYLDQAPYHLEAGAHHLEVVREALHGADTRPPAAERADDSLRWPEASSIDRTSAGESIAAMLPPVSSHGRFLDRR